MHANANPGLRAGRQEWVGPAVLTLPCPLYAMDLRVLNLAVPHLSADPRPSSAQLLWVVDVYGFMVADLRSQAVRPGRPGLAGGHVDGGRLAVGVVFVHRQQTLADPLLDLRLFRVPAFSAALTTNVLSFFVGFGALLFVAQYLQLVVGLSPLRAGLWMLPSSAGFIIGSMLTPLLARRARLGLMMAGGLGLAAVGFGLLTQLGTDRAAGLAVLVIGSLVFSLALAPVDTLATDLAVGSAPAERAGAASALAETSAEFGGALGIAVLGVVGTAVYRGQMAGARPGQLGQALLEAARQAFIQGLHLAFAASAAAAIAVAILAAVLLQGLGSCDQAVGPSA